MKILLTNSFAWLAAVALITSSSGYARSMQESSPFDEEAMSRQEAELELLGLQIAEQTMQAVADLLPETMNSATEALYAVQQDLDAQSRVLIGITGAAPSAALCVHLGVDAEHSTLVNSISPGMSAEKGGLRLHDIIVAIDGDPHASMDDLRGRLSRMHVGETLQLSVISHGQRREILLPLLEQVGQAGARQSLLSKRRESLAYEDALRQLAESEMQSLELRQELEGARSEMMEAQLEIENARAELEAELAQVQRDWEEERVDDAHVRSHVEAMQRYEDLLSQETRYREEITLREARERELQARAHALEAELHAVEAARFMGRGENTSLIYPEASRVSTSPLLTNSQDNQRLEQVEQRVDELHERFDRLEAILDRALSDSKD